MVCLIPFLVFVTICCLFLFAYHDIPWLVWCSVAFLGLFSITILTISMRIGNARIKEGRGKLFQRVLAVSCLFATMTSTVLGWYVFARYSSFFFALESRRVYVNVLPEEPAQAHADASWLFFSQDTRLDLDLSLGYLHEGTIYCVAPVLGDHDLEAVQYWVVGEGCCDPRGGFKCDDAEDTSVKSGLVVLDVGPLPSNIPEYRSAIEESEVAIGLKSAKDPLFLKWVADPEATQNRYQRQAIDIIAMACALHLVCSVFSAALVFLVQNRSGGSGGKLRL